MSAEGSAGRVVSRCKRCARFVCKALLVLVVLGSAGWGVLAIWFTQLPQALRLALAALYPTLALGALFFLRPRWKGILGFSLVTGCLIAAWCAIPPSNSREWLRDVAVLARAEVRGNEVTVRSIRNCDYRSDADYTVRYYDHTFDVSKLNTADLFLCYWGSPSIAHTMMSFGFEGGEHVCVSIETRKEASEEYSAIKGFFKQYELVYVVADERDVVRVRTNVRGEDVYLYRLRARTEVVRAVFLDYMRSVNDLAERPEWYNALTSNCTSNIRGHTRPYAEKSRWSWKLLVNGYLDELIYENGAVDTSLPFDEMKRRCRINDRARAADADPEFSKRIREGLPGIGKP